MSELPDFNRLVIARLEGAQHHSGLGWYRPGWALMVRHSDPVHTVKDGWARSFYDEALARIGADYAEVKEWHYVDELADVKADRDRLVARVRELEEWLGELHAFTLDKNGDWEMVHREATRVLGYDSHDPR